MVERGPNNPYALVKSLMEVEESAEPGSEDQALMNRLFPEYQSLPDFAEDELTSQQVQYAFYNDDAVRVKATEDLGGAEVLEELEWTLAGLDVEDQLAHMITLTPRQRVAAAEIGLRLIAQQTEE